MGVVAFGAGMRSVEVERGKRGREFILAERAVRDAAAWSAACSIVLTR